MKRKTYLRNQTIYQIYVRNHTAEGTFVALIKDLPRIKELGVDILYLLPIHPIGKVARKGKLGSPYAISDYYLINPELGTLEDFQVFLNIAHSYGFKIMIDIVLHHTSPDAELLKEYPEFYFYKNGKLGNKVGEWSDIIDLDYHNRELWDYMAEMLMYWADLGVDGFRADVAPLVPLAFWEYVRAKLDVINPDLIWLSESVEPHFITNLRAANHIAHDDVELYSAFDVLYDYDVYPSLKAYLEGKKTLKDYLDGVRCQEKNYPKGYLKIRTIENHDTSRIAALCKNEQILRNVTAWSFFQNGVGFIYAGQEVKAKHRPTLFDIDKVDLTIKDQDYYDFITLLVEMKKHLVFAEISSFNIIGDGEDDVIISSIKSPVGKAYGFFNLGKKAKVVKTKLSDGEYINIIDNKEVIVKNGALKISEPIIIIEE
ncbi:MAG: alpha-amylase family glycosyl hydrolase [Bacilli bacterium]|jgi:glycosidase